MEEERVFGEGGIRFVYGAGLGAMIRPLLAGSSWISRIYGRYQSSRASRKQIPGFVSQYQIAMNEFEETPYPSFNDFFIRKFKDGRRPFAETAKTLPAPCEARYLFFDSVDKDSRVCVKGARLSPTELLGGDLNTARAFDRGGGGGGGGGGGAGGRGAAFDFFFYL
jgi:phosphatidylserine decarboxylase